MLLLNFAHPLTPAQLTALRAQLGLPADYAFDLRTIATQFDPSQPFAEQTSALLSVASLSPEAWQTESIIVNLPSLNFIAALILAELHGRMGYFPAVLRLRPVNGVTPPQFELAEVLNLQMIRDHARGSRGQGGSGKEQVASGK